MSELPNIVLVHGAWADGSSWSAVVERLQADGYSVLAPQFPETSLAARVARLREGPQRQSRAARIGRRRAAAGPEASERPDDRRRTLLRRTGHDRTRHRRPQRRRPRLYR